ncbi:MAG: four helix bundle protein [bacterium]|nr:four helix bundle protein [bacterium]
MHKVYELYKLFYGYAKYFSKKDRYTLGQRCENLILDILELIFLALTANPNEKLNILKRISAKLNVLRIFIRLLKDIKVFDLKTYIIIQKEINDIGVMLGYWIKRLTKKEPKSSF